MEKCDHQDGPIPSSVPPFVEGASTLKGLDFETKVELTTVMSKIDSFSIWYETNIQILFESL